MQEFKFDPKKYEWMEDPKAKDVLDELGIRYEKKVISLSSINWRITDKNCGRLGFYGKAVSEENIDDYALSMKKGDRFPMPVVGATPDGPVIAAGVHRSKAAQKAGLTEITCYYFKSDLPQHLRMVAVLTNRKEGVRVTAQEAMEYAIDMCNNYNMLPKEVAKLLGISEGTLRSKLKVLQTRKTLAELGFQGDISDAVVRNFGVISNNYKVLREAAEYAKRVSLSENDSRVLVDELKKLKSEKEQLEFIQKEERTTKIITETPTQTGVPAKITLPLRGKFLRTLNTLGKMLKDKETLADLQILSEDVDHVRSEWEAIKKALNKLTR